MVWGAQNHTNEMFRFYWVIKIKYNEIGMALLFLACVYMHVCKTQKLETTDKFEGFGLKIKNTTKSPKNTKRPSHTVLTGTQPLTVLNKKPTAHRGDVATLIKQQEKQTLK